MSFRGVVDMDQSFRRALGIILSGMNAILSETSPEVRPYVLDTRPFFAAGRTPCHAIDEAVALLIPGQVLTLIVPFEPIPLYVKLGKIGLDHRAEQRADGAWQVDFMGTAKMPPEPCRH